MDVKVGTGRWEAKRNMMQKGVKKGSGFEIF